jgi:folate-binding protein YgfZ
MQSDLFVYCLSDELLLDLEPGLAKTVTERLEKYIVADDVQLVDVGQLYGLLSVQGPKAEIVVRAIGLFGVPPSGGTDRVNAELPTKALTFVHTSDATLGEMYFVNNARLAGSAGFDLFVPINSLHAVADKLIAAVKKVGGRASGWAVFETARIEAGIPRFGADMDETNIPLECGIEARAISYNKGCYIGQEVINRIHSIGHVNRQLCGLRLADDSKTMPARGEKLFKDGKEVGYITSAVFSPTLKGNIALGNVRREMGESGSKLELSIESVKTNVTVVRLPFVH